MCGWRVTAFWQVRQRRRTSGMCALQAASSAAGSRAVHVAAAAENTDIFPDSPEVPTCAFILGSRSRTSRKCPKWFTPMCCSKPAFVYCFE